MEIPFQQIFEAFGPAAVTVVILLLGIRTLWPELVESQRAVRDANRQLIIAVERISKQHSDTLEILIQQHSESLGEITRRLGEIETALRAVSGSLQGIERRLNG